MQADISALDATNLAEHYRPPLAHWVRSNMVLSMDGNFAGPRGSSRELSCATDLRVLMLIRALSDVVVVGARTAVGEKYSSLRVREEFLHVTKGTPRLCVVSGMLAFTGDEGFLQNADERPIILTSRQDSYEWQAKLDRLHGLADVIVSPNALTGAGIIESLHKLGLHQILCEGGPSLNALLAHDNVFDELAVTLAPIVVGQTSRVPPLGQTYSTWHRTMVGVADEYTFFRFTAAPLHAQP